MLKQTADTPEKDIGSAECPGDPPAASGGRPPSTTHDEITQTALRLFSKHGYESTTLDRIAAELGVGRRTIFRYFPSKNDIVWGDFDWVLERLRAELDKADPAERTVDCLKRAVIASNRYPAEELPTLRLRMQLITEVPALQAHSMLRYADWQGVVAGFVAERHGISPDHPTAATTAHVALAASMSAFGSWVRYGGDPERYLVEAWNLLTCGLEPKTG